MSGLPTSDLADVPEYLILAIDVIDGYFVRHPVEPGNAFNDPHGGVSTPFTAFQTKDGVYATAESGATTGGVSDFPASLSVVLNRQDSEAQSRSNLEGLERFHGWSCLVFVRFLESRPLSQRVDY